MSAKGSVSPVQHPPKTEATAPPEQTRRSKPEGRVRAASHTEGQRVPPGPRTPPWLQTLRWVTRPVEMLDACRRAYGDVFTMRLGDGRRFVVISDPELIGEVFNADPRLLPAGRFNSNLDLIFGRTSLPMLDDDRHLAERRMLLPAFHGKQIAAYADTMAAVVRREVATWPTATAFSLHERMLDVTFEVIMRTVFGVEEQRRRGELATHFRAVMRAVAPLIYVPWLRRRGTRLGPRGRFARRKAALDLILLDLVERRRREDAAGEADDVLALLLRARHEDGSALSDIELRDELGTLLLAGHETTASSLAWWFDLVLRHPAVLGRLRDELAGGDDRYLDATIKESQRLRPVLVNVGRAAARAIDLDGWRIPAGTLLVPAIHLVHRRPDIYPEPDRFVPERFLDGSPPAHAFIPFGGGRRRCLGASFALLEMRVTIRTVLEHVDVSLAGGRPERAVRRGPALAPRGGTRVLAHPLAAAGLT